MTLVTSLGISNDSDQVLEYRFHRTRAMGFLVQNQNLVSSNTTEHLTEQIPV